HSVVQNDGLRPISVRVGDARLDERGSVRTRADGREWRLFVKIPATLIAEQRAFNVLLLALSTTSHRYSTRTITTLILSTPPFAFAASTSDAAAAERSAAVSIIIRMSSSRTISHNPSEHN